MERVLGNPSIELAITHDMSLPVSPPKPGLMAADQGPVGDSPRCRYKVSDLAR